MEAAELVLDTMRKVGEPLAAGKIAELSGLDRKVVDAAMKELKFADDLVAYEDMKAYLIDEDADLQETNQDLDLIELIGLQNWLVTKLGSEK